MIPNCLGCRWELEDAYENELTNGWHIATTKDTYSCPGVRSHFFLILVDDDGDIMMR
jgi:hypothetical protein